MAAFKTIPEMILIEGEWTIGAFAPAQSAFDWPKLRGRIGAVYVIEGGDHCKIGMTTNLAHRFAGLSVGSPVPLKLIASEDVPLAGLAYAEAWLHQKFADCRVRGEWFDIDASQVVAALAEAGDRADGYAKCCEEWHLRRYGRRHKRKPRSAPCFGLSEDEFNELMATPGVIDAINSLAEPG